MLWCKKSVVLKLKIRGWRVASRLRKRVLACFLATLSTTLAATASIVDVDMTLTPASAFLFSSPKTMAGDTRDPNTPTPRGPPPGATSPPEHVQTPNKVYEVFHSPPENANALPDGSGRNTAGSHASSPGLGDAIKTVKLEDFKKVHMYPCVRESLLMGIGGGFGMGGIRALWGGMSPFSIPIEFDAKEREADWFVAPIPKAANWAVGTFVFAGIANYEFCLYRRRLERAHMKRAVEIIDRKKAEKEAAALAKREERRRLHEEAETNAEEAKKKSWKFW